MRPVRRREAQADKRRRILEAAVQAFGASGYYRTRISDIAKAADVADGTVYLYFESKEEILSTLFDDLMSRFLSLGRAAIAEVDGAPARLRRLIELHLHNLGSNRDLATVFQIELRHSSRFMEMYSRSHLREYFQLVADVLEEGRADGSIRADLDPWFATKCIFGIVDEAATNWVLSEKNYRLASVVDRIMDFVERGVAAGAGKK